MRNSFRAMRSPAVVALAFATACATAAASSAAPDTTPEVLVDQNGRVYRTTDAPTAASFPTPPDSTFKAVVAAYTALGFEPMSVDPAQRLVSRQHLALRSRFQGKALSAVFDCGNGQLGPRADQGRILADISSRVSGCRKRLVGVDDDPGVDHAQRWRVARPDSLCQPRRDRGKPAPRSQHPAWNPLRETLIMIRTSIRDSLPPRRIRGGAYSSRRPAARRSRRRTEEHRTVVDDEPQRASLDR